MVKIEWEIIMYKFRIFICIVQYLINNLFFLSEEFAQKRILQQGKFGTI